MFTAANQPIADQAIELLKAEQPMTLRQLFYRLISAGELENHKTQYRRLCKIMSRLRESCWIPRTWLVDHTRATLKPSSWSGLDQFLDAVQRSYRLNFWGSLPEYVEILVEKDAVAGTLEPVISEYDVALRVCRGYSSISYAGEIADQWAQIQKPIFAYYVGDHDPSGYDLERDLREKLERFSGIDFATRVTWTRLAIKPEDFAAFGLIKLPLKRSDSRHAGFRELHGDFAAEVDALPPNELRRRVREAIESHIEPSEWERLKRVEKLEKATVGLITKRMRGKQVLDPLLGEEDT